MHISFMSSGHKGLALIFLTHSIQTLILCRFSGEFITKYLDIIDFCPDVFPLPCITG